jgi:nicotinamide-nucleotide amidase
MNNLSYAVKTFKYLLDNHLTISFAESCTGGLCAQLLTRIPNASKVFNFSVITYSNESKIQFLGVPKDIIQSHGVVSDACVASMAKAIASISNSDIAISISGIAGPGGGSVLKPVGLVYFGFYINKEVFTTFKLFKGSRTKIQRSSAKFAYYYLYKYLLLKKKTEL